MKFVVSWFDSKDGIGVAVSEGGTECLLHRSNLSPNQIKLLKPRMVIHGEFKMVSHKVFLIEKVRTTKKLEEIEFSNLSTDEAAA